MIFGLLVAGLLAAQPPLVDNAPIRPRPVCREPWSGRKAWESLTLLRSDSQRHVWFLHLPQSAYLAPFPSAVGALDERGAKLVEYDGQRWWQYRVEWEGDLSSLRWVLADSGDVSQPMTLMASFYRRYRPAAEPWAVRWLKAQGGCLSASAGAPASAAPPPGFNRPRVDRAAPGLTLRQPDWDFVRGGHLPYADAYYTRDGIGTWMMDSEPAQGRKTYLYFFDGQSWEQRYRLPSTPSPQYLYNLVAAPGALWVNFGLDGLFLRYQRHQLCSWSAASTVAVGFGRMFADASGRIWISARAPSHGTFDLAWRYRELPHYARSRQDYPLERLFGRFDFPYTDELDQFENQVFYEYNSQLTPLYFENESWHQAAMPPREPGVLWPHLDALNRSKRCWQIEAVNRGRATLPS